MLGTLASAVLTQRAADRTRARESAEAERRRLDDRAFEARQALLATRRDCYIELNTASRHYHTMLRNAYHALLRGPLPDEVRDQVEQARIDHRAKYSVAQMVVPDDVLKAAARVGNEFNRLYGQVVRLAEGRGAEVGESTDTLIASLERRDGLLSRLDAMRTLMRIDLEVSDVPRPESPAEDDHAP